MDSQQQPNEQNEAVTAPENAEDDTTKFDREYVQKLRGEAAEARTQLKEATTRGDQYFEFLRLRTMERAAGDVLQALDVMPTDDPRYYDDAGMPSLEGMREVATEIADARPYLARVRGNVEQGAKEQTYVASTWSDVFHAAVN